MKKIVLLAAIGVAGLMSAKSTEFPTTEVTAPAAIPPTCVGVESDCGGGGVWFACGETNSDGELDYEVIDDMRQSLNEAFCDYGN